MSKIRYTFTYGGKDMYITELADGTPGRQIVVPAGTSTNIVQELAEKTNNAQMRFEQIMQDIDRNCTKMLERLLEQKQQAVVSAEHSLDAEIERLYNEYVPS